MSLRAVGRRSGAWLVAAGLIGIIAAAATMRAGTEDPVGAWIVVAREPLPVGLLLDERTANAALVAAPSPLPVGLRGVFSDPRQVLGRRLAVPVGAGEPVSEAALGGEPGAGAAPLKRGERAVGVPLSTAGAAGLGLVAGASVDVVASTGEGLTGTTALVVAGAEVLAVAVPTPDGGPDGPGEALLRVSAAQALRVTAALNFAREVRLLARPADEARGFSGPRQVGAP